MFNIKLGNKKTVKETLNTGYYTKFKGTLTCYNCTKFAIKKSRASSFYEESKFKPYVILLNSF